jgi:hypothetical protein
VEEGRKMKRRITVETIICYHCGREMHPEGFVRDALHLARGPMLFNVPSMPMCGFCFAKGCAAVPRKG